jgi:hypothetical protein
VCVCERERVSVCVCVLNSESLVCRGIEVLAYLGSVLLGAYVSCQVNPFETGLLIPSSCPGEVDD